ncbi:MAG: hypothetical protein SXA11_19045 [Cyanobacteriota bacterium]|nr:hypothetical protein [Cyanobacteriota bacterium]
MKKIFREYIAPLIALLIFLAALVAVNARFFLPGGLTPPLEEPVGLLIGNIAMLNGF